MEWLDEFKHALVEQRLDTMDPAQDDNPLTVRRATIGEKEKFVAVVIYEHATLKMSVQLVERAKVVDGVAISARDMIGRGFQHYLPLLPLKGDGKRFAMALRDVAAKIASLLRREEESFRASQEGGREL